MGAAAGSAGGRSTIRASATPRRREHEGRQRVRVPGADDGARAVPRRVGADLPGPARSVRAERRRRRRSRGWRGVGLPTDEERGIARRFAGDGAGPPAGGYDDGYEGSAPDPRHGRDNKIDLGNRGTPRGWRRWDRRAGNRRDGGWSRGPGGWDQLESAAEPFSGERGGTPGAKIDDAAPTIEREFDDPNAGMHVEGAEDEDFGLGRPGTQMSMEADTRFVGSLADR